MTTSLEAMKAARGRLQDLRESEFYWGKFLAGTRCGIREALTLLDAAIEREEAQPPSGVVSREAAEAACREAARMVGRFVSVPPEPMVPRSQALRAIREALDSEPPHDGTTTAEDEAARILDGGGHE